MPISALLFGGRRATTVPLVFQPQTWTFGVYMASTIGSETTAAAAGATGEVRRDPMAMLPFCGYHMGSYFQHWLDLGRAIAQPPAIFGVNWFRKGPDGAFLWPGYSENMRVLKWVVERVHGQGRAVASPLGWVPEARDLNLEGLADFGSDQFQAVMRVDRDEWGRELQSHAELFARLQDRLPSEFPLMRQQLQAALDPAPGVAPPAEL